MKFMKAIVDTAQKPLLSRKVFNYQQENMKPKSAYNYPFDFFTNQRPGEEGKTFEVDCSAELGDCQYW